MQFVVNCESHTGSAVDAALPSAFANSSSFCFIFFPFFPYGKFAFVKMNLFSATFELVLSERRTCSQQAENLFKFRRDAPLPIPTVPWEGRGELHVLGGDAFETELGEGVVVELGAFDCEAI